MAEPDPLKTTGWLVALAMLASLFAILNAIDFVTEDDIPWKIFNGAVALLCAWVTLSATRRLIAGRRHGDGDGR